MSSIVEGFSYDVFISYRQKDNKYDGWVTEFIDNLNRELDSMFKYPVSVYFDVNPGDYLLETYDVNASLKEKLRCRVFIPVLSRTYCDPKSYAWEHELKAFINQASDDQFGLKVKLANNNVASRILPIRIHDLEKTDIDLFESTTGGVIRCIDFIYKETGVNRQLREKDDDLHRGHSQVLYRDQINKTALTIKEIIDGMKLRSDRNDIKRNPNVVTSEKSVGSSVQGYAEARYKKSDNEDLSRKKSKIIHKRSLPEYWKLILSASITLIILGVISMFLIHNSRIKWAKSTGLQQLSNFHDNKAAFNFLHKVEKYLPNDPELKRIKNQISKKLTILTDPPGAEVFSRAYSSRDDKWDLIGITPLDSIRFPTDTFYHFKILKEGFQDVEAVTSASRTDTLYRKLFKKNEIPEGMIYVEGYMGEISSKFLKKKNGFFIDRFEVTNKQYKDFVNNGGYSNERYWKNDSVKNGMSLRWKEAIGLFVDKTGQPGPSTWIAGDYPEGQDNYPVTGISWFEAAAYAEYSGKVLPSVDHWTSAAGVNYKNMFFIGDISSVSNFNNKGPAEVGKYMGVNIFGAYDMAGNAREWCWNSTEIGKAVRGGAWDDAIYLYRDMSQLSPYDRSEKNGFRCAKYIDNDRIPETAFRAIKVGLIRDFYTFKPTEESTFKIYKARFMYDKNELNPNVEKFGSSSEDWKVEKVSFDAAYENERMIAYLCIPTKFKPPYQTVIYFPGSGALTTKQVSSNVGLRSLATTGRAYVLPVYKGTYERYDGKSTVAPNSSVDYSENLIKWVKDLSRTIDYLETRKEFDTSKIAYYGYSWGGRLGGIILAVENRIKIGILNCGGYSKSTSIPLPEADEFNYVPWINKPVLMLNGKYDFSFPLESTVKPFFRNLATPETDKRLIIYNTDHYVPGTEVSKEMLTWLDKYFGQAYR